MAPTRFNHAYAVLKIFNKNHKLIKFSQIIAQNDKWFSVKENLYIGREFIYQNTALDVNFQKKVARSPEVKKSNDWSNF